MTDSARRNLCFPLSTGSQSYLWSLAWTSLAASRLSSQVAVWTGLSYSHGEFLDHRSGQVHAVLGTSWFLLARQDLYARRIGLRTRETRVEVICTGKRDFDCSLARTLDWTVLSRVDHTPSYLSVGDDNFGQSLACNCLRNHTCCSWPCSDSTLTSCL